jgi:hypothetical protein
MCFKDRKFVNFEPVCSPIPESQICNDWQQISTPSWWEHYKILRFVFIIVWTFWYLSPPLVRLKLTIWKWKIVDFSVKLMVVVWGPFIAFFDGRRKK